MRAITALFVMLTLVFIGTRAAAPGGDDAKSSPLFKHSLRASIERLEGKLEETETEGLPTGFNVCPNRPPAETSESVCTSCGGPTYSTCEGQSTCTSTCANTCVGGSCANYRFRGVNYWYCPHAQGSNWNYGSMPHGMSLSQSSNALLWDDEGSAREFGPWDNATGQYDKTITRTVTTAGYTIHADAWDWFYYYGWHLAHTAAEVHRPSTQADNVNDLYLPLPF